MFSNQDGTEAEHVDSPGLYNFACFDGDDALELKVMENDGAWVSAQMVIQLVQIETFVLLRIQ